MNLTKNEALEQADADERGEFHPTGEVWINPDHPGAFLVVLPGEVVNTTSGMT